MVNTLKELEKGEKPVKTPVTAPAETVEVVDAAAAASINEIQDEVVRQRDALVANPDKAEQQQKWLIDMKRRFDMFGEFMAMERIAWEDVKKALLADPEATERIQTLDEKMGQNMQLLGKRGDSLLFVSGWYSYDSIPEQYRDIVFDKAAQDALPEGETCNGNAVDIAHSVGAKLAKDYDRRQILKRMTWKGYELHGDSWCDTESSIRETGGARTPEWETIAATTHYSNNSFAAEVEVKMV